MEAYVLFITIFAYMGAAMGGIIGLIFGILALVPSEPFNEQDVSLGVVLIVLSVTGVMELAGAIAAGLASAIFGLPILYCIRD